MTSSKICQSIIADKKSGEWQFCHSPSCFLYLLFNLRSFADTAAEVIQLGAAHLADPNNLYLFHIGRMQGKSLFNPDAIGNASDGKGLGNAAATLCDNGALKNLDSLSRALLILLETRTVSPILKEGTFSFNCSFTKA